MLIAKRHDYVNYSKKPPGAECIINSHGGESRSIHLDRQHKLSSMQYEASFATDDSCSSHLGKSRSSVIVISQSYSRSTVLLFTISEIEARAKLDKTNTRYIRATRVAILADRTERKRRDVEHNLACLKRTATDCKLEQTPSVLWERRSRQPICRRRAQTLLCSLSQMYS